MAIITLKTPGTGYTTVIDTGVSEIEIKENFLGISMITEEGSTMSIVQRDFGFEFQCDNSLMMNDLSSGKPAIGDVE